MNGITSVQCHECSEDNDFAKVVDGKVDLPSGWQWTAISCNWGDGKTLRPTCAGCVEFLAKEQQP